VTRLPVQPGERIDRSQTISFTFDGTAISALEGDTIGSALHAAGKRTISRSFKYHRRRGLLCCAGQCPNCLVAVDGAPGVRACVEPVREGMRVEHLNAKPGLEFDVMRATDLFGGPFTPPGFYYKTFIRPRRLWPLYEKILRHAAGLGVLPRSQDERHWRTEYRRRHADLLIVGGGAAGLHAAIAAAGVGADVVLVDEGPEPGGRLLAEGSLIQARALAAEAAAAGVEILTRASALGHYDGLVPVWQQDTLHQIRARRRLFATGTIEQPLVFAGNDLPGVMLADGARRLAAVYAVAPGATAVLATTGDRGLEAAADLAAAGVRIVAVADLRDERAAAAEPLAAAGAEILTGHTIVAASGRKAVTGATLAPLAGGAQRRFACDLILVSGGHAPASSLPLQSGAQAQYSERDGYFALGELPEEVHAAGDLGSAGSSEAVAISGSLEGLRAAHALGYGGEETAALIEAQAHRLAELQASPATVAVPPAVSGAEHGKCFACFCEDVTSKDIKLSAQEGYDSIELAKRYTTVTMGPCQGRMCQLASVRLMGVATGQSPDAVGLTTARPPWTAVPLGALAGRPFEPAKRSPIHSRHRALGAAVSWAGDWRRPYHYGDIEGEVAAVHDAAGLIDVSSLGKLLVRGPAAGEFLDLMYPNRFSDLKPERVRYGVLVSDAGRITDDGTVCRLDEDSFYVTTTSSGAGAVEQWFSWWLADWRMDAHLTDVTQALAAVNLAGPRSREVLQSLTDLDCSAGAFKYLDSRRATVAGVACLILRIGFVGELGYEIHFAAAHGEHVWDALIEAGAQAGIRPFGLEPQRVLRLQKQHVIVGQDTDSESDPYGAAMPWIVKLDKDAGFIGRWALEHLGEREPKDRLVGFEIAGTTVPTEGAVILGEGEAAATPAGQVTSARYSRKLGKVIGLAWVPADRAHDGTALAISDAGRTLAASVVTEPFYDPAGAALRS
jgi:sarcosine oxidase subunit alpha